MVGERGLEILVRRRTRDGQGIRPHRGEPGVSDAAQVEVLANLATLTVPAPISRSHPSMSTGSGDELSRPHPSHLRRDMTGRGRMT